MIAGKFVNERKHPTEELTIYNYTAKAQYEHEWNDCTLNCRGLIMDGEGQVVARPFQKFFNLEEHDEALPNETFEVYEKMDGSLGILYWVGDTAHIATRGSFESAQAAKATQLLNTKYADTLGKLDRSKTYLFEIIYPENRIVVDYGNEEKLVLLAVVDTQTGEESPLEAIGFPIVHRYDGVKDYRSLHDLEQDNKEGFVIRFGSGLRVKVKFEEYVRIHRIITQVSSISIWEYLATGQSWDDMLERVPDEFYNWVKKTKAGLEHEFETILNTAKTDFKVLETRKETALYFQNCQYPNVLFAMLDEKDVTPIIWKMLRPTFQKPFYNEEEA